MAQARQGLEELAALVKRVEGFEVTRLEYADDGMWRITGRAAEPEGMTAAQFNAVVVK